MALCPKCGQESTNEKFCSNCWSSMTVKPKADKKPENPFRNLIILAIFLVVFGLAMSFFANMMKPTDAPAQETPVATVVNQAPAPTDTPSVPTTGETPPPPLVIEPTDTPAPTVVPAAPSSPYLQ